MLPLEIPMGIPNAHGSISPRLKGGEEGTATLDVLHRNLLSSQAQRVGRMRNECENKTWLPTEVTISGLCSEGDVEELHITARWLGLKGHKPTT